MSITIAKMSEMLKPDQDQIKQNTIHKPCP